MDCDLCQRLGALLDFAFETCAEKIYPSLLEVFSTALLYVRKMLRYCIEDEDAGSRIVIRLGNLLQNLL